MFTGYAIFLELMKRIEVQDDSPIIGYTWPLFSDDPYESSGGSLAFTVEVMTSSNGTEFLYFSNEETNYITLMNGYPAVLYPGGYVVEDPAVTYPVDITRYDVNGTAYVMHIVNSFYEAAGTNGIPLYSTYATVNDQPAGLNLNTGVIEVVAYQVTL